MFLYGSPEELPGDGNSKEKGIYTLSPPLIDPTAIQKYLVHSYDLLSSSLSLHHETLQNIKGPEETCRKATHPSRYETERYDEQASSHALPTTKMTG